MSSSRQNPLNWKKVSNPSFKFKRSARALNVIRHFERLFKSKQNVTVPKSSLATASYGAKRVMPPGVIWVLVILLFVIIVFGLYYLSTISDLVGIFHVK